MLVRDVCRIYILHDYAPAVLNLRHIELRSCLVPLVEADGTSCHADIMLVCCRPAKRILTSKPIVGKVTFTWTDLTVDDTGVRTQGTFQLGARSPQVGISGPAAVSFPVENPGAAEERFVV